ncbi:hypothetical protein F1880_000580 [Penicillium rolfsii]|nr:hypothetical protein F1880_000580 [Penicillium rolfsii]
MLILSRATHESRIRVADASAFTGSAAQAPAGRLVDSSRMQTYRPDDSTSILPINKGTGGGRP